MVANGILFVPVVEHVGHIFHRQIDILLTQKGLDKTHESFINMYLL